MSEQQATSTACGETGETSLVEQAKPAITTAASHTGDGRRQDQRLPPPCHWPGRSDRDGDGHVQALLRQRMQTDAPALNRPTPGGVSANGPVKRARAEYTTTGGRHLLLDRELQR